MQADVNIKAADGHSALQGAQVVRPLTVAEYPPLDTTVITDRFTKLTRVVPLRKIAAYNVAVVFVEHWVFSYVPGVRHLG